jgi:hypothetical protein
MHYATTGRDRVCSWCVIDVLQCALACYGILQYAIAQRSTLRANYYLPTHANGDTYAHTHNLSVIAKRSPIQADILNYTWGNQLRGRNLVDQ